jgi:hypothetical protein
MLPSARLTLCAALLLTACAPLQVPDAPGARGHVLNVITREGIVGAQVCLIAEPSRCVTSSDSGYFSMDYRTQTQWTFILFESFPAFEQGNFEAQAVGFSKTQFRAYFYKPVEVALSPSNQK